MAFMHHLSSISLPKNHRQIGKLPTHCFKYTYIITFHRNYSSVHLLVLLIKLPTTLCSVLFYCSIIYYIITSNKIETHCTYVVWVRRQSTCLFAWTIFSFILANVSLTWQIQFFFNFRNTQNFGCKYLMKVCMATLYSTGYTAILQ